MPAKPSTPTTIEDLEELKTELSDFLTDISSVVRMAKIANVQVFEATNTAGIPKGIKSIQGYIDSSRESILDINNERILNESQKEPKGSQKKKKK